MNVYSIHWFPSLKLKICEFLGIASHLAIDQLKQRLETVEHRVAQLAGQVGPKRSLPRLRPDML